jgi:uncharacterized repeat protein (TIGR03943 family)
MKQLPVRTRQFLFTSIYIAWWLTLLSFVLGGAYRSFIRPSFVIFLWGALVILLVFIISGIVEMGNQRLRVEDIARGGILLLPLMALWMAYGKPLGSYAYMKKTITAQHPSAAMTLKRGLNTPASMPSARPELRGKSEPLAQPELRRNKMPAPLQVTILDLLNRPQEYQGKLIAVEGMAMRQETFSKDANSKPEAELPGSFILFRFVIVCCVADSQPLGLIVDSAKAESVVDNDWYRVTGRFSLNKEKMGVISHAAVSKLETPPDPPYLYENMGFQPGASPK